MSVEVSNASYFSYLESLNRSVIVLLLAAEVVLVTYDRHGPVALRMTVSGFSASCIAALLGEFLLYVYQTPVYHVSVTRHVLFIYSPTPPDWSREGDATTRQIFPAYYL